MSLGNADPIDGAVADWARAAGSPRGEAACRAAGETLRKLIWTLVVASLWQVQDEFVSRWMRSFYTGLITNKRSPREAVRHAELGMLREFRSEGRTTHPYYWGAFVATGR